MPSSPLATSLHIRRVAHEEGSTLDTLYCQRRDVGIRQRVMCLSQTSVGEHGMCQPTQIMLQASSNASPLSGWMLQLYAASDHSPVPSTSGCPK